MIGDPAPSWFNKVPTRASYGFAFALGAGEALVQVEKLLERIVGIEPIGAKNGGVECLMGDSKRVVPRESERVVLLDQWHSRSKTFFAQIKQVCRRADDTLYLTRSWILWPWKGVPDGLRRVADVALEPRAASPEPLFVKGRLNDPKRVVIVVWNALQCVRWPDARI